MNQQKLIPQSLQLYCYEIDPTTEIVEYHGELTISINRLMYITEELESLHSQQDITVILNHLEYHIENYLVRIYELRERVFNLLIAITGDKKTVDKLRHLDQRPNALITLQQKEKTIVQLIKQLLLILDEDIEMRNHQTHRIFLKLGFWDGYDIYNPEDVLVDMQRDPEAKRNFEKILFSAVDSAIKSYQTKVDNITQLTLALLKETKNSIKL